MNILLACPAPPRSRKGNRVTALRWKRLLAELGHRVDIAGTFDRGDYDLLIALHARKSYPAVARFRAANYAPIIVALTGTDLYRDLRTSRQAWKSLEIADRLVVLQPEAVNTLPEHFRGKARVIWQSAVRVSAPPGNSWFFDVCILGHLRHEKDPLRTALALRLLPKDLPLRVYHAGQAMTADMARQARSAMRRDRRYCWLGELPRWRARRLLARSRLLVLSSRMEGGANVVSEAIVQGVPVLASRIDGSVGMLGDDYPGLFGVGDTAALAGLMQRAATDQSFYRDLQAWCDRLAPNFAPTREKRAWQALLSELTAAR